MNFFLVDSPLQLLNAIEAQKYFKLQAEQSQLVIFEGVSKSSFEQIKDLAKVGEWGNVHCISRPKNRLKRILSVKMLNKISPNFDEADFVFIGEYRSNLMRHFANRSRFKQKYLLDDGNASVIIHKKIRNGEGFRAELGFFFKIIHKLTGIEDNDIFDIAFFTIYGEREQTKKLERNTYRHLKSKLVEIHQTEEIYFLGNCLPELDIVSYDYYFECIRMVTDYYKGKKVYYIPHRREAEDKLKKIRLLDFFEIKMFNRPIEWQILIQNELPIEISSFYSSALDNCYEIYGSQIVIRAFKMKELQISSDVREKFNLIFNTYGGYGEGFYIEEL